jgi:hypothetical protein
MPSPTIIAVRVKPRSRTRSLTEAADGTWLATLESPPVDGRANAELIGLVAARFACPKSAVTIRSGVPGRLKLVQIGQTR